MSRFDGTLPNNWVPRPYQVPFIQYMLEPGRNKHAELIWHRRSGKDDCCLHVACLMIHLAERAAPYWHMLPEAAQARKAIWDAVDPHTGMRRIDIAFPRELRSATRDKEMMILFKNGATWQVVGSDNYNSLVGSTLGGVTFSEWPIANPAARGFIRPILRETGGWQVYNGTPRGRNHAYESFLAAEKAEGVFAQKLRAEDTGVFTEDGLQQELQEYIDLYGDDVGRAFFEQEYHVSFEMSAVGAVYGGELNRVREEGRVLDFDTLHGRPVYAACDLGHRDATAFWFWQMGPEGELLVIDYLEASLLSVDDYVSMIREKGYNLKALYMPHDAYAQHLGSKRTVEEQFRDAGIPTRRVISVSKIDGIAAGRKTLPVAKFHTRVDETGLKLLAAFRYEWDDKLRVFRPEPAHDYSSHAGDAWRYLSLAWREIKDEAPAPQQQKVGFEVPIAKMISRQAARINRSNRRW
jgi:hypothetical protein